MSFKPNTQIEVTGLQVTWIMGMEKAAVFPLPVSAQPSKSLPLRAIGIACACIGVGIVYPCATISFMILTFKFWKEHQNPINGSKARQKFNPFLQCPNIQEAYHIRESLDWRRCERRFGWDRNIHIQSFPHLLDL